MNKVAESSSFLCTLPGAGKGIAYHVATCFAAAGHPTGVRFASFVGDGRRSFGVMVASGLSPDTIPQNSETLCRLAIGQAVRDHLYEKTREGDSVLDLHAAPWDGELRPVGGGVPGRAR